MIVLDTNAFSEALKPLPSQIVLDWLAAQEPRMVFITTITQAEVLYGIESLPAGKRKAHLSASVERVFMERFQDRILPFEEGAARLYAKIVGQRDAIGRPISQLDAMIAAIARSQNAAVATRNTRDFEGCGLRVINPWMP
jgi:predicted nucleic acid-binding protein